MSRLFVSRIRLFIVLVIATGLVGVLDGWLGYVSGQGPQSITIMRNAIGWSMGGSLVWGFEIFVVPGRYGVGIRHLHFLGAIAVKSLIMVLIVVLVTILTQAVWLGIFDFGFFTEIEFYRSLAFVLFVISVMQTVIQIVRIVGGRTLINFVLGRYLRPVRENKIFMFLDLVGSTALSEKLGDIGVQSMITNFFFDIAEPIAEHGGEIHRYVGDQVVVTWPLKDNLSNLRAIRCYFAIAERIRDKELKYERKFGTVPRFRTGLHGGPVVISQCGDNKQEISYFGDTVNTAARIEQQCKEFDCSLLISGELLSQIALPLDLEAETLGSVQLRGRARETELLTITARAISKKAGSLFSAKIVQSQ